MQFEWDEAKDRSNVRKHRIDFATASRVFLDPLAQWEQERHVNGEERWQRLGLVGAKLVLVVHTFREDEYGNEVIRIISARYPETPERRRYENT